jgi:hypothetical protein
MIDFASASALTEVHRHRRYVLPVSLDVSRSDCRRCALKFRRIEIQDEQGRVGEKENSLHCREYVNERQL